MKTAILAAALLLSAPVAAMAAGSVTCTVDAMTDARFCKTDTKNLGLGTGFYSMGTNDSGTKLVGTVYLDGYNEAPRVDRLWIRVDGGQAFAVEKGLARHPDVNCYRRSCSWSVTVYIIPTAAEWSRIANASTLKVSPGTESGPGVKAVDLDPAVFRGWLADFAAEGVRP